MLLAFFCSNSSLMVKNVMIFVFWHREFILHAKLINSVFILNNMIIIFGFYFSILIELGRVQIVVVMLSGL